MKLHSKLCLKAYDILKEGHIVFDWKNLWSVQRTVIPECNPIFIEPNNYRGSQPDVIGWHGKESYCFECKTSRQSFHNDKQKNHYYGDKFIYICPRGEIKPEELTWQGLVYCDDYVDIHELIKEPLLRIDYDKTIEIELLLSISKIHRKKHYRIWRNKDSNYSKEELEQVKIWLKRKNCENRMLPSEYKEGLQK